MLGRRGEGREENQVAEGGNGGSGVGALIVSNNIGSSGGKGRGAKKMLPAPLATQAEKSIGAAICIGCWIRCLLYVGFFNSRINMHLNLV